MVLCAVLAGGNLKDVGHAKEGLASVAVRYHLITKRKYITMREKNSANFSCHMKVKQMCQV